MMGHRQTTDGDQMTETIRSNTSPAPQTISLHSHFSSLSLTWGSNYSHSPVIEKRNTSGSNISLQRAMDLFVQERAALGSWGYSSVHKYRSQLQQVITFLGPQRLVQSLNEQDLLSLKHALQNKVKDSTELTTVILTDKSVAVRGETIKRYFNLFKSFCDFCYADKYLHQDIHSTIKMAPLNKNPEKYKTFTPQDLQRIFSSRIYTCEPGQRHRWKAQSFCFWLPLICAFTGARPGEASQIFVKDVYNVDGIWVLHITDQSAMQTLKNKHSDRLVPLHPRLIALGFLDFIEERRQEYGDLSPIFPDLRFDKRSGMARATSRWFSGHGAKDYGYLGVCGFVKNQGYCLYSFRHTFINALRRKAQSDMATKQLVGHVTMKYDITARYGEPHSLEQLAEAIKQIDLSVDLSHLSWSRYKCVMNKTQG